MYEISINDQVVKFNFVNKDVISISELDPKINGRFKVIKKAENGLAGEGETVAFNVEIGIRKYANDKQPAIIDMDNRRFICWISELHCIRKIKKV